MRGVPPCANEKNTLSTSKSGISQAIRILESEGWKVKDDLPVASPPRSAVSSRPEERADPRRGGIRSCGTPSKFPNRGLHGSGRDQALVDDQVGNPQLSRSPRRWAEFRQQEDSRTTPPAAAISRASGRRRRRLSGEGGSSRSSEFVVVSHPSRIAAGSA